MVLANRVAASPHQIATKFMLPNEEFALACRARYEQMGLVVDATNGQFAHCPYPKGMGETGYYLLWEDHQHQGLLQSKDVGKLCFFIGHVKRWLTECDPLPESYFELWDIYEEFSGENGRNFGKENIRMANQKMHSEKDELGRSIKGVEAAKRLNSRKDENGRSLVAMANIMKLNSEKDEKGRPVNIVKMLENLHSVKDKFGRSVVGVKSGLITTSQRWKDPDHPELGSHNSGILVQMQKRRGLPHGPENRIRVS